MCFFVPGDLDIQTRPSEGPNMFDSQTKTNKKVTDSTKNSLTLCSLLCVVIMLLVDLNFE